MLSFRNAHLLNLGIFSTRRTTLNISNDFLGRKLMIKWFLATEKKKLKERRTRDRKLYVHETRVSEKCLIQP